MDHMGLTKRPIGRIDRILAKIGNSMEVLSAADLNDVGARNNPRRE